MSKSKKELKINPVFEPLFIDSMDAPRYYQVYGGRGSGKSYTTAIAMVQLTYSEYGHKILYLRQTMTTSEDSTIADIRLAISDLGLENDFREVKGIIKNIRTGSTITFKGIRSAGTQTAKLKSLSGITTLVIEEAEEVESFEEFSKIDESIRIAGKPLKVILIYNPTSAISSWIHKNWFIEGMPDKERYNDTIYIHSTYLDNLDNLNPTTIQTYKRYESTNPIYYRNVILAEWTLEAQGRIYGGWGHYPEFEEEGDIWYGLDFGYGGKDKTACIKINFFEDCYYVSEVFSEEKLSIRRTISLMRENGIKFNDKIYADSAVPELISQIREGGYTSIRKATKGNKEAGIKKIQDKNIVLVGGEDTGLYYSYMTFRTDKKSNIPHEPDELAALRYGINSRKPLDKSKKTAPRRIRKRKGFL